ncbi:MAG: hypothetical protein ABIB61_04940 [Candidatus Shapirobacteria bacterium]
MAQKLPKDLRIAAAAGAISLFAACSLGAEAATATPTSTATPEPAGRPTEMTRQSEQEGKIEITGSVEKLNGESWLNIDFPENALPQNKGLIIGFRFSSESKITSVMASDLMGLETKGMGVPLLVAKGEKTWLEGEDVLTTLEGHLEVDPQTRQEAAGTQLSIGETAYGDTELGIFLPSGSEIARQGKLSFRFGQEEEATISGNGSVHYSDEEGRMGPRANIADFILEEGVEATPQPVRVIKRTAGGGSSSTGNSGSKVRVIGTVAPASTPAVEAQPSPTPKVINVSSERSQKSSGQEQDENDPLVDKWVKKEWQPNETASLRDWWNDMVSQGLIRLDDLAQRYGGAEIEELLSKAELVPNPHEYFETKKAQVGNCVQELRRQEGKGQGHVYIDPKVFDLIPGGAQCDIYYK